MRSRPSDAFVAAAASLAAVLGLTTLFVSQEWIAFTPWLFLAIAVLGIVLRRFTTRGPLVVLGQTVVVGWLILLLFARDSMWYSLPTWRTVSVLADLVRDCAQVLQRYAAPVPMTPGMQFCIVVSVCLVALVVDYVAVTRRSAAAAGLALLTVFLVAAANSGSSLAPGYFVVAALAWMVMVVRQGRWSMMRWSTTVASTRTPTASLDAETDALSSLGTRARQLGAVALVAAVALPAVLPHLPTRFILDGLGRNESAPSRAGRVGFNSTLDLTRSLKDGTLNPVLSYRTTGSAVPPPLRVVVASDYVNGEWRSRPRQGLGPQVLDPPQRVSSAIKQTRRQMQVASNQLEPPHLAAPYPVVAAEIGDVAWGVDRQTQDIYVAGREPSYTVEYLDIDVTADGLRQALAVDGDAGTPASDPRLAGSLALDPASAGAVRAQADKVTEQAATPYDAALAIQDWLRGSGGFTYSLTLTEPKDAAGNVLSLDPISSFLATKRGYCVQFATAMVMMARAKGIPARMAIGFLPGSSDQGLWTVRAADAHSWPELYIQGAGWLRFEPTPSVRSGTPPTYTTNPSDSPLGDPNAGRVDENGLPIGSPNASKPEAGTAEDTIDGSGLPALTPTERVTQWLIQGPHILLVGVVLGLLGAFVLPLTAALLRRRRRRRAADEAALAEAQWLELTSRLSDLGLPPPPGGTLRQWHRHYTREAFLDDEADDALGQVVATLERTRYARPDSEPVALDEQLRQVSRAAADSRAGRQRIRAFLAPGDAVRWWRGCGRRVASAPARSLSAATDRLGSLVRRQSR